MIDKLKILLTEYPPDRKIRFGIAVGALSLFIATLALGEIILGNPVIIRGQGAPILIVSLMFVVGGLVAWAGFQVVYGLVPDVIQRDLDFWQKALWVCVLFAWPVGPLLYYVIIVLRDSNEIRRAKAD